MGIASGLTLKSHLNPYLLFNAGVFANNEPQSIREFLCPHPVVQNYRTNNLHHEYHD